MPKVWSPSNNISFETLSGSSSTNQSSATFRIQEYSLVRIGNRISFAPMAMSQTLTLSSNWGVSSDSPRFDITLLSTSDQRSNVTLNSNGILTNLSLNQKQSFSASSGIIYWT
jgi:hypothetical protein